MLYLVSTPIGNLEDITFRAVNCLKACDYILCEDTRHSLKLLAHYEIQKPLISFHLWNESSREERVISDLQEGKNIALISDAGTPLFADPGEELVRRCRELHLPITALPGPCAAICGLTLSGFKTQPFQFVGFLPKKESELLESLEQLLEYPGTSICYESPQRIRKSLQAIQSLDPNRKIALARELTKRFETILTGTVSAVLAQEEQEAALGEIVLLIEGYQKDAEPVFSKDFLRLCVEDYSRTHNCSTKEAIAFVSTQLNLSKKTVYAAIHIL
ncbi:MAG: 16S rRNA (cytidine(1402)-2'-O)-methyltransferase [Verrucomicrobia bacterium]|nr:16S rRNA (cytidine(1402)-2'-O)-methyltransferase [Verrucomicrobiota bacterium]